MTEPARFRCFKCTMSFRIQTPGERAQRHVCPEEGCYLRFWSAKDAGESTVKIGIYPEELAA